MNIYRIQCERVSGIPPKQFNPGGNKHHYVRIYIEADPANLDKIELVKYTLHPSFKKPYRLSEDRSSNFDIKIWTYGYFDIKALLIMRDGGTTEISGYVKW